MRLPVLLLCAALLPGCSAQEEPEPLPVPPASPSASPTPQSLPSPTRTGVEGEVERAVLAYYAALNEAAVSGSTQQFRTTFTPACAGCVALADRLDDLREKGQRLDGARDEVTRLDVQVDSGPAAAASVAFTIPAYRVLDAQGGVVGTYPAAQEVVSMTLERQQDGRWLVISSRDATR